MTPENKPSAGTPETPTDGRTCHGFPGECPRCFWTEEMRRMLHPPTCLAPRVK
jgi:hypothetical protein